MRSIITMTLLLLPHTPAGACEQITDHDSRALCRARSSGRISWCETIRSGDVRHYCRGIVSRSATWCSGIRDPDLRVRCRLEVR